MMAGSLFHRNIPQILLIHIGVIDAVTLDTILKNFRAHHVKFITLDEALADRIYNINPNYVYRGEGTRRVEIPLEWRSQKIALNIQ
jgi:hypothetical protein